MSVLDETTVTIPANWQSDRAPVRRLHGLRFPVLPNGAWLAQVAGGAATLVGAYLQWGFAATLITGGIAAMLLGTLREAGKV